ncbi:MAG: NifU N-terminal domain-containing protein [Actinomycetota bacterium]|nr:NifU N-terminal domain-containing protein [Actinomycetota bacterium]
MPVTVSSTPNPNAVKFTVGVAVGGPTTYIPGQPTDDPLGQALLGLPGVTSVFLSADFVTLNKLPDAGWEPIIEPAQEILAEHFSGS